MRFLDGAFGYIKVAGIKSHLTVRLYLTQNCLEEFYGLLEGLSRCLFEEVPVPVMDHCGAHRWGKLSPG